MAEEVEEEAKGNDEGTWLTSYADLMTLIACFFILMVAFANFEDPTFQRKAQEFGRYFRGSLITDDGEQEEDAVAENKEVTENQQVPHENIDNPTKKKDRLTELNEFAKIASISEISTPKDVEIVFSGSAMFEPGKVQLSREVRDSLDVMIGLIKVRKGNFVILVEGHTDDTDINSQIYPSNWELSAARAAKVLSIFEKAGISRNRLVAVGYGDTRPSYINKDKSGKAIPANQRLNRRVVIKIITSKDASKDDMGLGVFFRGKKIPPKPKQNDIQKNPSKQSE